MAVYQKTPYWSNLSAVAGAVVILDTAVAAGYHCRIFAMEAYLEAGTATTLWVEQQGAAIQLSPVYAGSIVLPFNPNGWFRSPSGTGLKTVQVAGVGGVWSTLLSYAVVED